MLIKLFFQINVLLDTFLRMNNYDILDGGTRRFYR